MPSHYLNRWWNLYYDYEKYLLSPLKPKILALIEQYLPNISDPVYSVHQSFMWFLWLNWRKSTFYPLTAPNDSKCWPIVTSSIQEPAASNCDITMTNSSRVVAMDAFLTQWCWGQWFNEFVIDTYVPSFSTLFKFFFYFVTPVFQHGALLVLLIGPLVTNFSEILIGIPTFAFKKMHLKVSSAKWHPFYLSLDVLKSYWERRWDDSLTMATIHDDTWNMFKMQYITPNLKR